jgi:hypothetical protein
VRGRRKGREEGERDKGRRGQNCIRDRMGRKGRKVRLSGGGSGIPGGAGGGGGTGGGGGGTGGGRNSQYNGDALSSDEDEEEEEKPQKRREIPGKPWIPESRMI